MSTASILAKLRSLREGNKSLLLEGIGVAVAAVVVERTLRGIGADGKQFEKYSPKYLEKRLKAGRGSSVNLSYEGLMLSDVSNKVEGNRAIVYFPSDKENIKAYGLTHGKKPRKFFAIGQAEVDSAMDRVKRHYKGIVGG